MSRSPETPDRQSSLGRVLVVDDDRRMASGTAQWLCGLGWHASAVGSADEAIPLLDRGRFDACVVDGLLPDRAAQRLLTIVRTASPTTGNSRSTRARRSRKSSASGPTPIHT